MKRSVLVSLVFLVLFLIGCVHQWYPACRHTALFTASVVGEDYPVRFVIGTYKGEKHVEAQAKIDGEWQWIGMYKFSNKYNFIMTKRGNLAFIPEVIVSYEEFMEKMGEAMVSLEDEEFQWMVKELKHNNEILGKQSDGR